MRLILFDCDGTLIDGSGGITTAMSTAFLRSGLRPPPPAAIRGMIGLSLEEMAKRLLPLGTEVTVDAISARYRQVYFEAELADKSGGCWYPGIVDVIEQLDEDETLLGIATGKSRRALDHALADPNLRERFVVSVTADDATSKPAPDMVDTAIRETGVERERVLVVGDTVYDYHMAQAANVHFLGAGWGYHGAEVLSQCGAAVASAPQDLHGLINDMCPLEPATAEG